jgi:hypothetical protein
VEEDIEGIQAIYASAVGGAVVAGPRRLANPVEQASRTVTGRMGLSQEDFCGRRRRIRSRQPGVNHAGEYSSRCPTSASMRGPIQRFRIALRGMAARIGAARCQTSIRQIRLGCRGSSTSRGG